jgi:hypothetical protein
MGFQSFYMLTSKITLMHKIFFQLVLHSASRNLLALTELQSVGNVNICLDSNLGASRRVWMTGCSPRFVTNLELRQPKRTDLN